MTKSRSNLRAFVFLGAATATALLVASVPPSVRADAVRHASSAAGSVVGAADVAITKAAPQQVSVGGEITYALDVVNNGAETATGVTVTDALPSSAAFVSASAACGYATGTHIVTCVLGEMASGGAANVRIVVNATAEGTITNTARVSAPEDDQTANNSSTAETVVGPPPPAEADVSVTKTDSPDPATAGQDLSYKLRVKNNGPDAATGLALTDTLPLGLTYVSSGASQGSCAELTGTVTCDLGTLEVLTTATVSIVVRPTAAGTITNTASVDATEPDPSQGNNSATARTDVEPAPGTADLSLTKTDAPDPLIVGDTLTYSLSATNNGPDRATNVIVSDKLPAGVSYVSSSPASSCTYTQATRTVSCNLGAAANTATETASIVVTATTAGTVTNSASVRADQRDPSAGNNVSSASTLVGPAPAESATVTVADYSFTPASATVPQGSTVRWEFKGPHAHTATDASGMGLFRSGTKATGTSYSFKFNAAAVYGYRCSIHPVRMRGAIDVPLKVKPASGDTGTAFTITWAAAAPPSGFVSDIQVQRPGAASYVDWRVGQTARGAAFVPDSGSGAYSFRARLRKPSAGRASLWSTPSSITVSDPATEQIRAQAEGTGRPMSRSLIGLNGFNARGPAWNDPAFNAAVAEFAPGNLRYPGGTIANYWYWRQGWYQPGGPWPGQPGTPPIDNTLSAFSTAVTGESPVPVFVLNMLTRDGALATESDNAAMIDDQVQFLQAARDAGLPVRMVELGNEFYLEGPVDGNTHNVTRFPTAGDYGRQANAWVDAIRAAFPGAKIAAVGADASGFFQTRVKTWNTGVLEFLTGADALTLHVYIRVANAGASPQSLLALPYKRFQRLKANEFQLLRSHGLEGWISEYNLTDLTPELSFAGTWMHGLFASTMTLLLLRDRVVTQMSLYNIVGSAKSSAIFGSSTGFGTSGPATTPLALTAAGTTLDLIQRAARGATSVQALSFSPQPTMEGGATPSVIGTLLGGGERRQAVILNLSGKPLGLNVDAVLPGGFGYEQLTAASLTTRVTGPGVVNVSTGTGTGNMELPPHSITRLYE